MGGIDVILLHVVLACPESREERASFSFYVAIIKKG
jgi:hypothetical protein